MGTSDPTVEDLRTAYEQAMVAYREARADFDRINPACHAAMLAHGEAALAFEEAQRRYERAVLGFPA